MRIAVSSEDNRGLEAQVAQHFGRCPYFTFVDVEDGAIQEVRVLDNPHYHDHRPGAVPDFVKAYDATMIIAGGMGRRAVALFQQAGIEAYTGADSTVRRSLESAMGGELEDATPCPGRGGDACDEHGSHSH
ncbi:MAG: NifB/NifX family molybdenum-iron cluster-binding protein [Anaerolineae bacterium]